MSVVEALHLLGGVASWGSLRRLVRRAAIEAAVAAGDVVVEARGRYALPAADAGARAALRISGAVARRSAAAHWGWAQKLVPPLPEVTVPKHRRLESACRTDIHVLFADLAPDEVVDGVTTVRRTLLDCLRSLPFDEALAIADSALRAGDIAPPGLSALVAHAQGPGSRQMRKVARLASGQAANPFESVLRALAIESGLRVRPQLPVYAEVLLGRPDLVDPELRVVLEADSFEWHGSRSALRRDARRYNSFVVHGWLVLRFSWEDVMHDPDYVRSVLRVVARGWTEGRCWACHAA